VLASSSLAICSSASASCSAPPLAPDAVSDSHERVFIAPAPQSQKKRLKRAYDTSWPAWQRRTHTEQQPSELDKPHV